VEHFKGKVGSWDVVNEAFEDNGALRNNIWKLHLGADYIARCFQYAHAADPDALLFYNDFGHDYSKAKRDAIGAMLNNFKARGIPINGTGLQFHTWHKQSNTNFAAAINEAAASGLKVHISELDISLNQDNNPNLLLTDTLKQLQAAKYKFIVQVYKALPQNQQFGITTWNVTDADSWIPGYYKRPDWPLPFDNNYQRKPAYYAMIEGAK
jgi:endo-1,4-beta-xylanase